MPRVYLRNDSLGNLEERVSAVRRLLQMPVRRFLEQPGSEALACFQKIFNAFAESPFLGLSALAGIVGLFAYAKALRELESIPVHIASLISAADVTAFGLRLGVPFVLLALALATVIFGLIAILAFSHRNERTLYWGVTVVAVISCAGLLTLYGLWVEALLSERVSLFVAWFIASVLLLTLAWRLYGYGTTPGIALQDEFHRQLLCVLRRVAHPGPLLLGVLVVGLYLTLFSHYSILFDPPLGQWRVPALGGSSCANVLVLERKASDPPIFADRITAVGSVLLVQRLDQRVSDSSKPGTCSAALHAMDSAGAPRPEDWLVLQAADVRCVRPLGATGECDAPETHQPEHRALASSASIAQYAQRFLDCDAASFRSRLQKALIFSFEEDHPRTRAGIDRWAELERTAQLVRAVPISWLRLPDLEGVRGRGSARGDAAEFLRSAAEHPDEKLWVLGFASVSGHSSWNADLSENRARAVLRYLEMFDLKGRYRGLGANLFSGLGRSELDPGEQIAVAFLCHERDADASPASKGAGQPL